jgi:hypothetical protein
MQEGSRDRGREGIHEPVQDCDVAIDVDLAWFSRPFMPHLMNSHDPDPCSVQEAGEWTIVLQFTDSRPLNPRNSLSEPHDEQPGIAPVPGCA